VTPETSCAARTAGVTPGPGAPAAHGGSCEYVTESVHLNFGTPSHLSHGPGARVSGPASKRLTAGPAPGRSESGCSAAARLARPGLLAHPEAPGPWPGPVTVSVTRKAAAEAHGHGVTRSSQFKPVCHHDPAPAHWQRPGPVAVQPRRRAGPPRHAARSESRPGRSVTPTE
jgi:hypothetical protein